MFHYQFVGRHLRSPGLRVRGVLVLDIPRIAMPPLNLNLAIDFVVGNYLGDNWKALRQDTQYAHPFVGACDGFGCPITTAPLGIRCVPSAEETFGDVPA